MHVGSNPTMSTKFMRSIDYISVDKKSAISGLGDEFHVGEIVGHQDTSVGTAVILGFEVDSKENEVLVTTSKGTAHLPFIVIV